MTQTAQPKKPRKSLFLLLLLIPLAGYLWWRPIQAEHALEDASTEELRRITQQQPNNARAFYHFGLRLSRARQETEALEAFTRAATLDPESDEIGAALVGAVNAKQGPPAAFRLMHDYLKRHPDSETMKQQRESLLGSLQRASDGFAAAKRYDEAIRYYQMWVDEDPNAKNAQEGLLKTLQAQGDKEKTFDVLMQLVEKNPGFAAGHVLLGDLYLEAGFFSMAKKQLEAATKLAPDNAQGWHTLGRALSGDKPAEAEQAFQKAADLIANNPAPFLDLAAIQVTNQKPDEAEKNYRRALQLAPQNPTVLTQVGGFLVSVQPTEARLKEAEGLLKQALAREPQNGDATYYQGRIAQERKNPAQAIPRFEKALTLPLSEDTAAVWFALSRAYGSQGNTAQAARSLAKSRQIRDSRFALARTEEEAYQNPRDPLLRLKVARLYVQSGQYVKAISQYQGCLALAPNQAEARKELDGLTTRLKSEGKLPSMQLFAKMVAASASTGPQ